MEHPFTYLQYETGHNVVFGRCLNEEREYQASGINVVAVDAYFQNT